MAAGDVKLKRVGRFTVINKDATLVNGARAAGDFDNNIGQDGDGAEFCEVYLTAQYDGGPPSAGVIAAELFVLPGNGESPEVFPTGGDGTVGGNADPQSGLCVGSFECVSPSTSTDEVIALSYVPLHPCKNRFVLKNTSGQTMDATWQLDIVPFRRAVAQS